MTEEKPIEATPVKTKQYLLLADQSLLSALGAVFPALRFVEVEGFEMKDNAQYNLLVNPKNVQEDKQ